VSREAEIYRRQSLRALADPNKALTRSAPRNEQDLAIAAHNGWIISLDNLSYVSPEKSDSLCRVSTGAGFAARTLYSDDEETIISRPAGANHPNTVIEDIGTRSDLLDREIIIEVPNLKDRKSEGLFGNSLKRHGHEYWEHFLRLHHRH